MKLLTCKDATRLASQGLDRKLGFGERLSLRVHLAVCGGCAAVARDLAFLRKAMAKLGENTPAP